MKRIIWGDYIGAYLDRNDEKTIIDKVCEEAAEEGVLNDIEIEYIHEELVDELYQKQYEDAIKRKHAYTVIAENLWNAAAAALEEGNLAESMAIGDIYNSWVDVCVKKGVL